MAAKEATKTIPIVFVYVSDPVGLKIVDSLAHPGGNATGLSSMTIDLASKQVEIFQEISPTLSRLAILVNPNYPLSMRTAQEMKAAAEELKLTVDLFEVTMANDLAKTMGEIGQRRPDGLIITIDIMFVRERRRIAELAVANGLPTMAYLREMTAAGILDCMGPMLPICSAAPVYMLTRFCEGQSQASYRSSSRPNSISSSISRLPKRFASPCRLNYSCSPTR